MNYETYHKLYKVEGEMSLQTKNSTPIFLYNTYSNLNIFFKLIRLILIV